MSFQGSIHRLGRNGRLAYLDDDGAFVGAGVPLLKRDAQGRWQTRPQVELERLFAVGLGAPIDLSWRMTKFASVARALNAGDRSLAAIALVQAELPLFDLHAALRMAKADGIAKAFDPDEPRDDHGRWTTGGNDATPDPVQPFQHRPRPSASNPSDGGASLLLNNISYSQDNTPVPLTDDSGRPILNAEGKPILRPAGLDPHVFVSMGLTDQTPDPGNPASTYSNIVAHLWLFRQGGLWDAQRADGQNLPQFRDYASVAIGLYAAAAGVPIDVILSIQNEYASRNSRFDEPMDGTYAALARRNVENTRLGYELYASGRIGGRTQ